MIRTFIKRLYNFGTLSPQKRDFFQKKIRDTEWAEICQFVPAGSTFLDVGCGAGYNLQLAKRKGCIVTGIDPAPYQHGVGRLSVDTNHKNPFEIITGSAESLPFNHESFQVVYSSHVLEHIRNKKQALQEFDRVLQKDGVLILGMPTATMAWINFLSQIVFNTHKRFIRVILSFFTKEKNSRYRLIHLIVPRSHSFSDKTIFYDLSCYRVKNWEKIIRESFEINQIILPAIYPYPDFVQFFSLRKSKVYSSSVFFICSKKR